MYTRYREAVEKMGLNALTVSKRSGIPTSTLYSWLYRAEKDPAATLSIKNAQKLAEFLGLSLDELMGKEGEA